MHHSNTQLSAFLPSCQQSMFFAIFKQSVKPNRCARPPVNKPKPNTRFLRNLVRETDSHNAALLAREAADSKARLEQLATKGSRPDHDIRRRQLGNITAVLSANASGKRKTSDNHRTARARKDSPHSETKHEWSRRRRHEELDHHRVGHRSREIRGRDDQKEGASADRSHRSHDHHSNRRRHGERHIDRDRGSRSRSRSPRRGTSESLRRRERSPVRHPRPDRDRDVGDEEQEKTRPGHRRKRTPLPEHDSDPLEEIVGPLPPPNVQARGRGPTQASSGIDARFSETYDPALDLSAGDGDDGDDWDMVLDRLKWRQQGAERLRAAGFTDKEVEGWESGKKPEVRWAKSGEGREWDRGKDS